MNKLEPLTIREYDVLCGLITRKSKNEIAEDLGVTINTVKFHSKNIYAKWQVARRSDVVVVWTSHVLAGTADGLIVSRKNQRTKYRLPFMPVLEGHILESQMH
jgi:DNA-binding CsgD family transcriptional regulator